MNAEQTKQGRKEIAEFMGFKVIPCGCGCGYDVVKREDGESEGVPYYHSDRDDIERVEHALSVEQMEMYIDELRPIGTNMSRLILATAEERFNAILKVISATRTTIPN